MDTYEIAEAINKGIDLRDEFSPIGEDETSAFFDRITYAEDKSSLREYITDKDLDE